MSSQQTLSQQCNTSINNYSIFITVQLQYNYTSSWLQHISNYCLERSILCQSQTNDDLPKISHPSQTNDDLPKIKKWNIIIIIKQWTRSRGTHNAYTRRWVVSSWISTSRQPHRSVTSRQVVANEQSILPVFQRRLSYTQGGRPSKTLTTTQRSSKETSDPGTTSKENQTRSAGPPEQCLRWITCVKII